MLPRVMADPSAVGRALQNLLQKCVEVRRRAAAHQVIVRPADASAIRELKAAPRRAHHVRRQARARRPSTEVEISSRITGRASPPRPAAHLRAVLSRRRCGGAAGSWQRAGIEPRPAHHAGPGRAGRGDVRMGRGSRFALHIRSRPKPRPRRAARARAERRAASDGLNRCRSTKDWLHARGFGCSARR